MRAEVFNNPKPTGWPLFTTVSATRDKFASGTKVMVAIGGWGDTSFTEAASTEEGRDLFSRNVGKMVNETGADGTSKLCKALVLI